MIYLFPRAKFVDENGIVKQLLHVMSEVEEAMEASLTPDIRHTAEEVMDAMHSLETLCRVLEEKYDVNMSVIRQEVIEKNAQRSYYENRIH